ncbi:MAG: TAXI family TRAP transporter solute-binding subunit [Pseudomonadota bacterium]|nr:TAXI family TRAP transporter solute-binding subunit [Pseudomonadota bacterium]
MKSHAVKAAILATAVTAFTLNAGTVDAKLKRITIGSNPQGSVYFLLASGFAKLFQEKMGIRANAQPHAGSSVYLPLMNVGEITLGMNSSLDSGMAWSAVAPYKSATKNVRAIARVWILPYAYMAKDSSGIKTLADLKGKRVVVKFKTNVSLAAANKVILSSAGLKLTDVTPVQSGGVVASIGMVVRGRVDAAPIATGMPALRKAHATVPGGLRIIPIGPKGTDEFLGSGMAGLYTVKQKNSKRKPFVKGTITIAAFDSYLNAGSQVSNEDAYQMAKAAFDNWKQMQKDYPPLRGTKHIAPANNPVPYHPGAARYYKEVGIYTDANAKKDAALLK